jgi:hypothetical protein
MEYEYQKLEENFKKLPEPLQRALASSEITEGIQKIAERYQLMLDQESVLYDITAYTMLGLSSSKDFVKNLSSATNIDNGTASKIADDINKEIFSKIKEEMQATEKTVENDATISTLNQAGNFTVEPQVNEPTDHLETPSEVIEGIENPVPAQPRQEAPVVAPVQNTQEQSKNTETMLLDHLLSGPVVAMEQKTEQKAVQTPPQTPTPKPQASQPAQNTPKAADPYRETI